MSDAARVVKNTMSLNIATVVNNLIAFVLSVYIGRYLGTETFGQFSFILAFIGMFAVLADLGLSRLLIREIARNREQASKYSGNTVIIKLLLGAVTFLLIFIVSQVIEISSILKIGIAIAALYMVIESLGKFLNCVFDAFEKMEFTAILQFSLKLFTLIAVFVMIHMRFGLIHILWAYVFAGILYIFLSLILLGWEIGYPILRLDFALGKTLLTNSLPFAISGFLIGITNHIDMNILMFIKGADACGLYGAARRLVALAIFIPANFTGALYPLFSRFYKTSKESLVKYHKKAFQLLFIIALPLALFITILARQIVILVWKYEYIDSVPSLQILAWSMFMQFIATEFAMLLAAIDKQKTIAVVAFWTMVVSISSNLILVRFLSYIGASIAAVITGALILCMYLFYILRDGYSLGSPATIIKIITAASAMGACLYFLQNINLLALIILSFAVYTACLLLLRVFTGEHFIMLKQLFGRK